ncbi:MAG: ABC transporter permease subunit [Spirochaetales bacterium]
MYGVQLAFKRYSISKGIVDSPWVGLKYFEILATTPSSLRVLVNTLVLSFYGLVASFPLPILLAIALNETRRRFVKKSVQLISYAPYFISTVVAVGMLLQLLDSRSGIINRIIVLAGGQPVNFMADPGLFSSVYVWSGIWQTMGYSAVIYLAALSSVSTELQDAANIDGCTRLQRIRHVDIPSIMPTVTTLLVLNFGSVMSIGFEKVYLMQNALNLDTSEIIATYVYKVGLINSDYGLSTAIGLLNSVINVILLLAANRIARRLSGNGLW